MIQALWLTYWFSLSVHCQATAVLCLRYCQSRSPIAIGGNPVKITEAELKIHNETRIRMKSGILFQCSFTDTKRLKKICLLIT